MITIVGLPQALAKIAAVPIIAEKLGQVGLEAGKELVAAKARVIAPKRTGDMARGITVVPEGVAATVPYSGFPEFGTRYMRAQPFMQSAFETEADGATDLVTTTVRTALYAL